MKFFKTKNVLFAAGLAMLTAYLALVPVGCVQDPTVTPTAKSCEAEQKRLTTDARAYSAYYLNFNPIENGFQMSDLEEEISAAVQQIKNDGSTAVDAANSAASEGLISPQAASIFISFYGRLSNQITSTSGDGNGLVSFLESEQSSLENSGNSCQDKEFTTYFISNLLGGLDHDINLFVEDKSSFFRNGWCKAFTILDNVSKGAKAGAAIGKFFGPKGIAIGGALGGAIGLGFGISKANKNCSSGSGGGCQAPTGFFIRPDPSNCDKGTVNLTGSNSISLFDWKNTNGTPATDITTVPFLAITQISRTALVASRIESFCSSNSQLVGTNLFRYNVSRSGVFSTMGIIGESNPQLTVRETYNYSVSTAGNQSLSVQWSLSGGIGSLASNGTQASIVFRKKGTGVLRAILTSCDGSTRTEEIDIEVQ